MNSVEHNKELVEQFPFLIPRNNSTDLLPENYDYSYTLLDDVEDGWQMIFLDMCTKIKKSLVESGNLDDFRIIQIKEKYGFMTIYTIGATKVVEDIIKNYSNMSGSICIKCGKPATKLSTGWISPFCNDCAKLKKNEKFISILTLENGRLHNE